MLNINTVYIIGNVKILTKWAYDIFPVLLHQLLANVSQLYVFKIKIISQFVGSS